MGEEVKKVYLLMMPQCLQGYHIPVFAYYCLEDAVNQRDSMATSATQTPWEVVGVPLDWKGTMEKT